MSKSVSRPLDSSLLLPACKNKRLKPIKKIKLSSRRYKPRTITIKILINSLSTNKQPGIEIEQNIITQNNAEGIDLHKIVRKTMEYFKLSLNDTKAEYWSNVSQTFNACEDVNASSTQFIPESNLIPSGEKSTIKLRFLSKKGGLIDLNEFSKPSDHDKSSSQELLVSKEKT